MVRTHGIWLFIVIYGIFLEASAVDPGHDGYIINCYLDNVKSIIRHRFGDNGYLPLPDFTGMSDVIRGRKGSFENVANIYRVDDAKLTAYGAETNMRAAFYMPDNHFYYEITLFGWMKIDLEVSVLTNAIDVNFNYTKSNNSYSIHHNPDALYISMLEGSTVSAHIDSLHHNLIPAVVAEYAEFAVESFVGIFVDTGLIFFVRAGLTDFLYQSLVAAVSSIDMRDIFDGQSQCGSLTL